MNRLNPLTDKSVAIDVPSGVGSSLLPPSRFYFTPLFHLGSSIQHLDRNHHPRDAKLINQHPETISQNKFVERHSYLSVFCQCVKDALGFYRIVQEQSLFLLLHSIQVGQEPINSLSSSLG